VTRARTTADSGPWHGQIGGLIIFAFSAPITSAPIMATSASAAAA
jgi:hypothetical protein